MAVVPMYSSFCIAMIVIGIPMILVENVIGRRLRVNSIDAFGDKIQDKGKTSPNIGRFSATWGCSAHLVSWPIIWCLVVWVMSYIISLINNTLIFPHQLQKKWLKISTIYISATAHGNHALHLPVRGGELHHFSKKGIIGGLNVLVKYLMPLLFIFPNWHGDS